MLVTLGRNYLSISWVLEYSTVAGKVLRHLHSFLFIVIIRDPLDSTRIILMFLLNSHMDIILSSSRSR